MLYGTLFLVLPLAVIVRRGCVPIGRDDLEGFARAHALVVTPANAAAVLRYLSRGRYHRTIGAAAGYLAAVFIGFVQGSQWPVIALLLGLAGYFVGAFVTEIGLARRRSSGPRAASLVPRSVDDYVAPWATRWPWLVASASVAVLAAHGAAAREELLVVSAATTVAVVVLAFALRASLRYVASRPQPLEAPDLLEGDEAIRSASSHVLAATGLAVACLLVAMQLWVLASAINSWPSLFPFAAGVVFTGFAIGAWRDLSRDSFPVRRGAAPSRS